MTRRISTILVQWLFPAVAVLAVLGIAFVILAPRLVSIEVVRRSMSREIAGWSGRSLVFDGTPTVTLTPRLTVSFPKARITSNRDGTTLVEMDELRAEVPFLPLLFRGRIEPSAFIFRHPRFTIAVDNEGGANWDLPSGLNAGSPLHFLTLIDGSIDYSDASGRHIVIDAIDADLALRDPHGNASIQGTARWKGERSTFYGTLNSPADLLDGKSADISLALESRLLRGAFEGSLRRLNGLAATGELTLATTSLTDLAQLSSVSLGRMPRLGAASVSSSASLVGGTLALGGAVLTIDGNQGVGALSMKFDARPSVQATLAFDSLDLSLYLKAIRDLLVSAQRAPDAPLDWPRFDAVDADLRISAEQIKIDDSQLGRIAASLALRNGRLDLAIGDMQIYGGHVTASLSADMLGAPSGMLQARLDSMPLSTALNNISGITALDGTLEGTISLQARGESWNALLASITGRGNIAVREGTLSGINLSVLTASTAPPASLEAKLFNGETPFTAAKADLIVGGGSLVARNATVEGTDFSAEMTALMRLGEPQIMARGTARLGGERQPPLGVPFEIGGRFAQPILTPDFVGARPLAADAPATSPAP